MARRRTSLDTPRQLRLVEDMDGFSCVLLDRQESKALGKRIMVFHLIMMACFITVIGAIPAWLAAAANIILSARFAGWRVRCGVHGVSVERVYSRSEPGVEEARGSGSPKGPKPMGLGQVPEPDFLPFSEIETVRWNDYSLVFELVGGGVYELELELTSRQDIERLGGKLRAVHREYLAGVSTTPEQAAAERKRLAAVVRQA